MLHFQSRIKSGIRYGLAYLVVSVVCTLLIVAGNDLLADSVHRGNLCDAILQLDYEQWLPVCAAALAFLFVGYLLFARLFFKRLPLPVAILLCGIFSIAIALIMGIIPFPFSFQNWYEIKNFITFFIAGCLFALFAGFMD